MFRDLVNQFKQDRISQVMLIGGLVIVFCAGCVLLLAVARRNQPRNISQPTVTPVDTPALEAESIPVAPAPKGIGVTRREIQTVFESLDILHYEFDQYNNTPGGEPRFVGLPGGDFGRVAIELIGPPDNLTRAAAGVLLPNQDENIALGDIAVMEILLKTVIPDWDSASWLSQHLDFDQPPTEGKWQTTRKDLRITLTSTSSLNDEGWLLTVTIDRPD